MPEGTLATIAPEGAHFAWEEVKTARGQQSLGDVPILVWDDLDKAVECYTVSGILDVLDGTSIRVSFQNIARRYKAANKSDDEIAAAQVAFRPGKRVGGVSTPKSRAAKAAGAAAEKVGGDVLTSLLDRIARGEISEDQLAMLAGVGSVS